MAISTTLLSLTSIPLDHGFATFFVGTIAALFLWFYSIGVTVEGKEPPIAKSNIPLIGHLVGLYNHGVNYLDVLRKQTTWPAYTMTFLKYKTYVVTTPALSHAALRSKSLSLEPLSSLVAGRMLGLSKEANRLLGLGPNDQWIGSHAIGERRVTFSKHLASGPGLIEPSQTASNIVADGINKITTEWIKADLFMWLRDAITYGTVQGLYGPKNPVALDESLIEDIWVFDDNQLRLSWNFLQWLVAPAGLKAMKRLSAAFVDYFNSGNYKLASPAVLSTVEMIQKLGIGIEDYSRLEIFNISVATVNTVPTAVSMMFGILAQPQLLKDLREEIKAIATTLEDGESGRKRIQLDISHAQEKTPLLFACYQEALRIGSTPTCNRAVLEDTLFTDPTTGVDVFMRKDQRVSIPTFLLHNRETIWGDDAMAFNPWRFMPGGAGADSKGQARNQGFVPYGGGVHLCPGRHLAKMEILAVGALMTMALDFEAANGGHIKLPVDAAPSATKKLANTQGVRIRRRAGYENVEWSVKV